MKKRYRLTRSQDFKTVLDYHHSAGKNPSFSLFYMPNKSGHAHIGISVSTKIGDAIVRARVRRQIRAQIQEIGATSNPFDIVIIAHPGILTRSYSESLALLQALFSHVGQPKEEKA
ncbi:MAG: ribonuclease P protein component [Bacilli bacterium]|jgi:ribonuclease P protein component